MQKTNTVKGEIISRAINQNARRTRGIQKNIPLKHNAIAYL